MLVYAHGGVSAIPKEVAAIDGCLPRPGVADHALDIVQETLVALEDHPELNAGYGSTLNLAGELELDAGIADGTRQTSGAVAGVRVRHPIVLARRVLEQTPHVLLAGAGASELGSDLERLDDTTEEQRARWERARDRELLDPDRFGKPEFVDTVGAVALDDHGRLAAGSSTGGVFGKMRGRVGDSPIFGAGFYASPQAAIVGTGVGELFIETLACLRVALLMEDGLPPQQACEHVIEDLGRRRRLSAGLLALDARGRLGAAYRGGAWAVAGQEGRVDAKALA